MKSEIVADKINALLCVICSNGYFTYLNPHWSHILGWSIPEIMATPSVNYVHPEDRELTINIYQQLLDGEDVSNFRNRYRKRSGEYVWLQWCATPLPEEGFVASVHQIDDVVLIENKLKQHTVLLEQVNGQSKPGHWSVNFANKSVFWSSEIYAIHGVTPKQYKPELKSAINFYHPEDVHKVSDHVNNALAKGEDWNFTLRIVRPDGAIRTVRSLAEIARDAQGQPISVFGVFQDVTDYVALTERVQLLSDVVNATNASIVICDNDRKVVWVNAAFSFLTGYELNEMVGRNLGPLLQGPNTDKDTVQQIRNALNKGQNIDKEILNYHKDGSEYWTNLLISPIRDSAGRITHILGIQNDITKNKKAEEKLKRIAHHDLLTTLPNRVLLADRLNQAMVQCKRRKTSIVVAFMDLDNFKAINDNHGHDVGDKLLIALSKRMQGSLRGGDTLARIGGDEFTIVMVDLKNIQDREQLLARLLNTVAEPITVDDAPMQLSASIGVALYPQDDANVDADQLMRQADQAMYLAKQAGKNCYRSFNTAQDKAIQTQRKNIHDVSTAFDRGEFVLFYQPKVNINTSEVIGVEALIRWQHPDRGLIPPLDFLPSVEGHTISVKLGEWVIDTALSQISQWQLINVNLPISINISAYQLQQRNFTSRLTALLAAHPEVDPHYLELEILETSALSDISQVSDTMMACQGLGVHFALDDFGTGYSSLTHLRRLPAYLIKIDQSFVRDMLEDDDDLAIVQSVIDLAKTFKRKVIAEGVETIAHGEALLKLGCELGQGYGIARPMPAVEIPQWVSNYQDNDSWQAFKGP